MVDVAVASPPDEVDVVLAQRLRRCSRDRDEVARLDNGRFVLAARTPGGHPEAHAVAERVRRALSAPVHVDGAALIPIVTIGVSGVVPGSGGESMFAAAEMALEMARWSHDGIQIVELA